MPDDPYQPHPDDLPPEEGEGAQDPAATRPPEGDNPWVYLAWVRTLALDQRYPYQDAWVQLVARRPRAEQDALISEGREPFRYRMETARQRLKELAGQAGQKTRFVPTVITDECLAEMVYRPGETPAFGFLVHLFAQPEALPELVERIQVHETLYQPLQTRLIEQGAVLVASEVQDYGTPVELLAAIHQFLWDYVQVEAGNEDLLYLAAAFVQYTWGADRFEVAPYFAVSGDFSAGKTTLLNAMGHLSYRPVFASGAATAAPLFRIMDRLHGTLIVDEMDFDPKDPEWKQILKIMNAGWKRRSPVIRAERANEGEAFDVYAYDCFGPKVFASRRALPDAALVSRCLTFPMVPPSALREDIPLYPDQEFFQRARQLQAQLLLWRFRHYRALAADPRQRILGVENRVAANGGILLSTMADPLLRARLEDHLRAHSKLLRQARAGSLEGIVAEAAVTQWFLQRYPPRVALKAISEHIHTRSDLKEIRPERVGNILRGTLAVPVTSEGGSGYSYAYITEAHVLRLAENYGVEISQYPPLRTPFTNNGRPA